MGAAVAKGGLALAAPTGRLGGCHVGIRCALQPCWGTHPCCLCWLHRQHCYRIEHASPALAVVQLAACLLRIKGPAAGVRVCVCCACPAGWGPACWSGSRHTPGEPHEPVHMSWPSVLGTPPAVALWLCGFAGLETHAVRNNPSTRREPACVLRVCCHVPLFLVEQGSLLQQHAEPSCV